MVDEFLTAASQRYEPEAPANARFQLVVVEGPDAGTTFTVDGAEPGPALLGQSEACTFRLADREVSRRHVELDVEGRRLRITDLKSTNGTFVDGVAVMDAYLSGGELVRLGTSALRVDRLEPDGAGKTRERRGSFGRFIGQSPEVTRLYPLVERLAASNVTLVIEGETGTGKEVLAEAIHEHSARKEEAYVVLDCTTIPPNLAESELFGHERGAFTGATGQRRGVFEQAHGGTLFVDEIGDLDVTLQAKLLRAIERGEIRRVGGADVIRVDVRVIAATRRDLDRAVQEGTFRDDLFHRLAVGRIALPPLRKRRGDIAVLARYFWSELSPGTPLPAHLLQRWESDDFPGNVRELKNAIARQLATGDLETDEISQDAEPETDSPLDALTRAETAMRDVLHARLPFPVARLRVLEALQKAYVERALAEHDGSVERAAAALGIGRRLLPHPQDRQAQTLK
ncbi:MAG: sigma 54-interacting transcriptional regulator [Polyangiaceae bacterium]|nr:sigma 54-interacting transcriptional regulator [Polyangiaceae bacterium]